MWIKTAASIKRPQQSGSSAITGNLFNNLLKFWIREERRRRQTCCFACVRSLILCSFLLLVMNLLHCCLARALYYYYELLFIALLPTGLQYCSRVILAPVSKGIFFVYVALLQSKLICFLEWQLGDVKDLQNCLFHKHGFVSGVETFPRRHDGKKHLLPFIF